MSHVQVNFLGKGYRLACGPGEEARLTQLAEDLNERLNLLDQRFGGSTQTLSRPPEIMLWIMTALTLLDETYDLRQELDYWRGQPQQPAAPSDTRQQEMEQAMANTLNNLAQRLEKLVE